MTNSTIRTSDQHPNLHNILKAGGEEKRDGNSFNWTLDETKDPIKKKIILLVNEQQETSDLITKCLSESGADYEMIHVSDASLVSEVLDTVNPDLIISDWQVRDMSGLDLVRKLKAAAETRELPVLVFGAGDASYSELGSVLSAGAIDCIQKTMDQNDLKVRIAAVLRQMDLLRNFKEREERIRKEREQLSQTLEKLKMRVDTEQRESTTRLELLIHSMGVKDKLLDRIHDLRPYLNAEGKTKLTYIAKQLKWELSEEKQFNLEQRFDEKNYDLYTLLEKECSELTKNEKRLCAYFNANHSATEIARITHKSSNSINVAFARIRTKLNISTNKELKVYLADLLNNSTLVKIEEKTPDAHLQQVG